MAKEYIERKALIKELEEELAFDTPMYTDEENKFINRGLKIAIKDVNSIPIADVIEVVRCKDCKYHEEDETGVWCSRVFNSHKTVEDNFCKFGAKMDKE